MPGLQRDVRNLTDITEIVRLLQEVQKREKTLDAELEESFERRNSLETKLDSLQQLQPTLNKIREESEALSSRISETCKLAEDVSGKVRELDTAQSRMVETLKRIELIIHLKECIDKVQQSMQHEEYEDAARHAEWFLEQEHALPDEDGKSEMRAKVALLQDKIRAKFKKAAITKNQHKTVLSVCRLMTRVGLVDEGAAEFAKYVQAVVRDQAEADIDNASRVSPPPYLALAARLLDQVAARIDEFGTAAEEAFGEGRGGNVVQLMHTAADPHMATVLRRYSEYRNLPNRMREMSTSKAERDARELDVLLDEMSVLTQRCEQYYRFLRNIAGPGGKFAASLDTTAMVKLSLAYRIVQDIVFQYVALEQVFMGDNVQKAMKMEEVTGSGVTSSVVDDVFYILHKCCRRALSTCNMQAVVATLTNVNTFLNKDYKEVLRKGLKESDVTLKIMAVAGTVAGTVAAKLDSLGVASKIIPGQMADKVAVPKISYTTVLNNISVSSEYIEKLRSELEPELAHLFADLPPSDRVKAHSLLDDLRNIAATFNRLSQEGVGEVCNQLGNRVRPLLDGVQNATYRLDDAQYADNDINDPWCHQFIQHLDNMLRPFQSSLTPSNFEELVSMMMQLLAKQLEQVLVQKRFNQLGGLQLDREVRALVTYFSHMTQRTVRDKFARLTQIASILNLEKVQDLLEFWGDNAGPLAWRLTANEVRRTLALRIDFNQRAIDALKLK